MNLEQENVQRVFSLFSGEELGDESDRAALCMRLCGDCAAQAERLLADLEEDAALTAAAESWAAALAWYQLCLLDEAAAPQSVTADGVRLDEGDRAGKAQALCREKREALVPWLGEEAFYFGGTEG